MGEIVNLMSVDAERLQQVPQITTVFFTLPVLIVISTVLIWRILGPSSLTSLAVLAVVMPLNGLWIANKIRQLQVRFDHLNDAVYILHQLHVCA